MLSLPSPVHEYESMCVFWLYTGFMGISTAISCYWSCYVTPNAESMRDNYVTLLTYALIVACCCWCMVHISHIHATFAASLYLSHIPWWSYLYMFIWCCLFIVTAPTVAINATTVATVIAKATVVLMSYSIVCGWYNMFDGRACFSYHAHATRCNLSLYNFSLGINISLSTS